MQIALALGTLGQGMGLAMSPATDAIMGALPRAKAGIGSAMNDVVREVGGTLGIAVLGSLLTRSYGGGMNDAIAGLPARPRPPRKTASAAPTRSPRRSAAAAARSWSTLPTWRSSTRWRRRRRIAAAAAVVGALIALAFLPSRTHAHAPASRGIELREPLPA